MLAAVAAAEALTLPAARPGLAVPANVPAEALVCGTAAPALVLQAFPPFPRLPVTAPRSPFLTLTIHDQEFLP